jgi:paraquat-inducible protein B
LALREKVLANLDGTTRPDASDEVNEARLRELERELERDLAGGGVLPEERLREIQHELVEAELIDAEFLDEIWREAEAEEAALQEAVQDEAEDVDALLRALAESLEKSPSPERTAALESGLQALQNELRGERGAVEAADFALANEHASLIQTLGQPGSSQHAASAQRIAEVQQQRIQLRIDWRERMQRRLEAARQELRDLQSVPGLRDETLEAEVARKIALLEHEVNSPAF